LAPSGPTLHQGRGLRSTGHHGQGEAQAAQPIDDGRQGGHGGRAVPAAVVQQHDRAGWAAASTRHTSWSAVTPGCQSIGSTLHSLLRLRSGCPGRRPADGHDRPRQPTLPAGRREAWTGPGPADRQPEPLASPQRSYAMSCASASAGRLWPRVRWPGRIGAFQRHLRETPVNLSDFPSRTHPEFRPTGATRCQSLLLAGQAILGADLHGWLFLLVTA
jgi:hypothetical protein